MMAVESYLEKVGTRNIVLVSMSNGLELENDQKLIFCDLFQLAYQKNYSIFMADQSMT